MYAVDTTDLTKGDDLGGTSDQVTVDGIAPYITDLDLTNPTARSLNISFNSTEQLANATVDLSGPENTEFSVSELTERNIGGT